MVASDNVRQVANMVNGERDNTVTSICVMSAAGVYMYFNCGSEMKIIPMRGEG